MNSFGRKYRVSIFGESHGVQLGVCIDGCPAGIALCEDDFTQYLDRRRSGARGTTPRKEADIPQIVAGVFNGFTTGAPIVVLFTNENTRSGDYANLVAAPRPGHADFVATRKYSGFADYRGGGHFSGRITLGLVVAGTLARKIMPQLNVAASIVELGGVEYGQHQEVLEKAMQDTDSIGGIIECRASGIPVGLGEPFFDSAEALIAHAVFSIPAIRGIEFGSGFATAAMRGSEHNDPIIDEKGTTKTNNAGGINGGITNGNDIVLRVVVKPTSSIAAPQDTFNFETGKVETLVVKGRHDACIALRVPVVLESVVAMVLADLYLVSK